jgi:hypothetical protein
MIVSHVCVTIFIPCDSVWCVKPVSGSVTRTRPSVEVSKNRNVVAGCPVRDLIGVLPALGGRRVRQLLPELQRFRKI